MLPPNMPNIFLKRQGVLPLIHSVLVDLAQKVRLDALCERSQARKNSTLITCYEIALLTSEAVFGNRKDVARILLAILRASGPRAGDWAMCSRAWIN